jgi:hypothetical protein
MLISSFLHVFFPIFQEPEHRQKRTLASQMIAVTSQTSTRKSRKTSAGAAASASSAPEDVTNAERDICSTNITTVGVCLDMCMCVSGYMCTVVCTL